MTLAIYLFCLEFANLFSQSHKRKNYCCASPFGIVFNPRPRALALRRLGFVSRQSVPNQLDAAYERSYVILRCESLFLTIEVNCKVRCFVVNDDISCIFSFYRKYLLQVRYGKCRFWIVLLILESVKLLLFPMLIPMKRYLI